MESFFFVYALKYAFAAVLCLPLEEAYSKCLAPGGWFDDVAREGIVNA
jgi:hypothetical protein